MSIGFERRGKFVRLNVFSKEKVIKYLQTKLNIVMGSEETGKCGEVMVNLDDADFFVNANMTWIKVSFDKANAETLSPVIEEITKWSEFSEEEETFYVQVDDDSRRTIIFENGFSTTEEYRRHFKNFSNIKIIAFKAKDSRLKEIIDKVTDVPYTGDNIGSKD